MFKFFRDLFYEAIAPHIDWESIPPVADKLQDLRHELQESESFTSSIYAMLAKHGLNTMFAKEILKEAIEKYVVVSDVLLHQIFGKDNQLDRAKEHYLKTRLKEADAAIETIYTDLVEEYGNRPCFEYYAESEEDPCPACRIHTYVQKHKWLDAVVFGEDEGNDNEEE